MRSSRATVGDSSGGMSDQVEAPGAESDGEGVGHDKARPGICSSRLRRALRKLLSGPGVLLMVLLYAGMAWVMACLQELFPLWSSMPVADGGLAFETDDIGKVQMAMGVSLITYTCAVLPLVSRRLGALRMFQLFAGVYVPVTIVIPFLHGLVASRAHQHTAGTAAAAVAAAAAAGTTNTTPSAGLRASAAGNATAGLGVPDPVPQELWAALLSIMILRSIAGPTIFTAIGVLLNNCAATDVGALNGVATALAAIARCSGPVLVGQLLSWGERPSARFPVDYHFPFFVVAFVMLLCTWATFWLPRNIGTRVEERGSAAVKARPSGAGRQRIRLLLSSRKRWRRGFSKLPLTPDDGIEHGEDNGIDVGHKSAPALFSGDRGRRQYAQV